MVLRCGKKGQCHGVTFAKITLITGVRCRASAGGACGCPASSGSQRWKIVMGIPGPQYDELAKTYRRDLERHGV